MESLLSQEEEDEEEEDGDEEVVYAWNPFSLVSAS